MRLRIVTLLCRCILYTCAALLIIGYVAYNMAGGSRSIVQSVNDRIMADFRANNTWQTLEKEHGK